MRLLNSTLASTSSGSYLILQTHLTVAQALQLTTLPVLKKLPLFPEPDWSLLTGPDMHLTQTQLIDWVEALTRSPRYARQQIHTRNLVIEGN